MNVFFISDTHFSHKNIISYEGRPFESTEEMDITMIKNWNDTVKPNDLVFHLGDVFFCNSERMKWIANRLNGRKILIRGNHDKGISNTKFHKLGFDVYNYYIFDNYLLSHYPQHETALRTLINNTHIQGNLHGHVHSQIQGLDQSIYQCVSVELTEYRPKHIDEVWVDFATGKYNAKIKGGNQ